MEKDIIIRIPRKADLSLDGGELPPQNDIFFIDQSDTIDTERLILSLKDSEEVQVLVLRFIGYTYTEIQEIMNLESIGNYYTIWRRLKRDALKIKEKSKFLK